MKEFLQSLFRNPYDRGQWRTALESLLVGAELWPMAKKLEEDDKIVCHELGQLITKDGYPIGIFEYEIKKGKSIDRSRTGLRNLVKSYLKYHVDGALVVFHDSEHWRCSFICDLRDEKTAPKRFTYVFGYPDQSYRTPLERLEILSKSQAKFTDIYEAFSVDKLDKDFFKGYKDMYNMFCKSMPDGKEYRDFIKRMMGRVVFLYYLQKKGWLGGDKNYMQNLLERSKEKYENTFLSEVLGTLFFDTLNKRRPDGVVNPILGEDIKIPYLNGGLFERGELDRDGVDFQFEYFEKFFGFLSSYNFTIDENAPDDAEVGVDPEMLGHIFENLLEDNKDKGAYYTPKEVVQYMCRESIFEYLRAKTDASLHENIRRMVYDGEFGWLKDCPVSKEINGYMRSVKICDPAIGSGVFPMMMINELYRLRMGFYEVFNSLHLITPYKLKRDIIENNIYGVDLDYGAVEIARLRLWLAIMLDDDKQRALPNLDYKIMQGNSLIETFQGVNLGLFFELDEEGQPLHSKPAKDKQGMVAEYFGMSDQERKYELKTNIEECVRDHVAYWSRIKPYVIDRYDELDKTDIPFFLWNVYFQDVMDNGGFDIVIGNPPYGAASSTQDKKLYKREYGTTSRSGKYKQKGSDDTYSLFIEQGFNLLKKDGVLWYIVPMSVTSSDSMQGVHTLLTRYCREIKISSFARHPKPVFENAMVSVSIISFVKTRTQCEGLYMTKMHRRRNGISLEQLLSEQKFIEAGDFVLRGRFPKISEQVEKDILTKFDGIRSTLRNFVNERGSQEEAIYYRTTGGGKFEIITNYPTGSTQEKPIYFNKHIRNLVGAILSSNLYHWYYQVYSDDRHIKNYDIESFPFPIDNFSEEQIDEISEAYEKYLADIESNAKIRKSNRKDIDTIKEYKIGLSKTFINILDDLICPAYGLSKEETEFVKNHDIEFRMPEDQY